MTIGSVDLVKIQQILNEMQTIAAMSTTVTLPSVQGPSFAAILAQATNGFSNADGGALLESLGVGTGTLGASSAAPSTGDSSAELSLIAQLLSSPPSTTAANVTGASTTSASDTSSGAVEAHDVAATSVTPVSNVAAGLGSVVGNNAVNEAMRFVGTPYVWGGTTPQGFDCSGFAQYVYRQLGINLPRTSEEQATVGTPVPNLANAQPGDLLFFAGSDGTSSSPGHVGIYVGNGQMIDAPYTGTTVQVQALSSAGQVVAIRRVVTPGSPGVTG
jgi:cell wall-associated NlpC family hydrolase